MKKLAWIQGVLAFVAACGIGAVWATPPAGYQELCGDGIEIATLPFEKASGGAWEIQDFTIIDLKKHRMIPVSLLAQTSKARYRMYAEPATLRVYLTAADGSSQARQIGVLSEKAERYAGGHFSRLLNCAQGVQLRYDLTALDKQLKPGTKTWDPSYLWMQKILVRTTFSSQWNNLNATLSSTFEVAAE